MDQTRWSCGCQRSWGRGMMPFLEETQKREMKSPVGWANEKQYAKEIFIRQKMKIQVVSWSIPTECMKMVMFFSNLQLHFSSVHTTESQMKMGFTTNRLLSRIRWKATVQNLNFFNLLGSNQKMKTHFIKAVQQPSCWAKCPICKETHLREQP